MEEEQKIKEIIFRHIPPGPYKIFVFGSRAKGTNRKWSDIDIGISGPTVPYSVMSRIEGELEESDIPYKVDIVDFSKVSDKFKEVALKTSKLWTK